MATYRISLNDNWVLDPRHNRPVILKLDSREDAETNARDIRRRFPNGSVKVYAVEFREGVETWGPC